MRALIQRSLLNVAFWLGERGHDAASARLYDVLAGYEPDAGWQAYLRYRALVYEGRNDEALLQLEQAIAVSDNSAPMLYEYGWLLQREGRHGDAVDAFDRSLALDASSAACHADRGFSLMRLGRWPEAEAALRRALRHDEGNRRAWHDLGLTLAQAERFDEAIAALQTALRIGPQTSTSVSLAFVFDALERSAEAEAVLRDAHRTDPANALVISLLAGALVGQERAAEALELLTSVDPALAGNPATLGARVFALLALDRTSEARETAEHLLSVDDSAYARAITAWARLRSGELAGARTAIHAAVEHYSSEVEPTIEQDDLDGIRAAILSASGEHEAAVTLFARLEEARSDVFAKNPPLEGYVVASRNALAG